MAPIAPDPLLVRFGVAYAICALGLLCSRVAARRSRRRMNSPARAINDGTRRVAKTYGPARGAEIDAAVDRLAARWGVPRVQLTRDLVDKEFRREVHRTWSTNLARASRPRRAYTPTPLEDLM